MNDRVNNKVWRVFFIEFAPHLAESFVKEALNKSSFCGKRFEYMGFFRKNNLKSEVP